MKRKAEDLTRGDVIINFLGAAHFLGDAVVVGSYGCGSVNVCDVAGNVTRIMLGYDTTVEVESPTLTPAQQHAEELLYLVRSYPTVDAESWEQCAREILAKIDPPKPPSLEELAQVLDELREAICTGDSTVARNNADAVLKRARQAGYLGKDAQ